MSELFISLKVLNSVFGTRVLKIQILKVGAVQLYSDRKRNVIDFYFYIIVNYIIFYLFIIKMSDLHIATDAPAIKKQKLEDSSVETVFQKTAQGQTRKNKKLKPGIICNRT